MHTSIGGGRDQGQDDRLGLVKILTELELSLLLLDVCFLCIQCQGGLVSPLSPPPSALVKAKVTTIMCQWVTDSFADAPPIGRELK